MVSLASKDAAMKTKGPGTAEALPSGDGGSEKHRHGTLLGVTSGAVLATVAAAATWYELDHRKVTEAMLLESQVKIDRLCDIKLQHDTLAQIEQGLLREWGPFALVGFSSVEEMAAKAGASIFIALHDDGEGFRPKAALQTTLTNVHGDPEALRAEYPTFQDLTSPQAWKQARHGGDTAILLQIAVLENDERGAGIGSLLRNAVLHMQPASVRYALTTTPADLKPGAPPLDLTKKETFTPAMKFHFRGGAESTVLLQGYKTPPEGTEAGHATDVSVMRYSRDDAGAWPMARPEMRLRRPGPFERGLLNAGRRVRSWSRRRGRHMALPRS